MTMLRTLVIVCVAAMPLGVVAQEKPDTDAAAPAAATAGDAEALLQQINEARPPKFDASKRGDQEYVKSYMQQQQEAMQKRNELARQFVEQYPDHPQASGFAYQVARMERDPEQRLAMMRKLAEKYPGSDAARSAQGEIRRADGVGKPFELAFTDAISGKDVSMNDLKGKVVVVDFWATWCGPCVAEMPKMKELYATYKDKGVEFIGISLDQPESQGGLERLKQYVKENQILWPQYYQGKGWDSEFSKSWGINSIPALFVIDAEGKLHSANARGKLEKMIPELIAKRDGTKTALAD